MPTKIVIFMLALTLSSPGVFSDDRMVTAGDIQFERPNDLPFTQTKIDATAQMDVHQVTASDDKNNHWSVRVMKYPMLPAGLGSPSDCITMPHVEGGEFISESSIDAVIF